MKLFIFTALILILLTLSIGNTQINLQENRDVLWQAYWLSCYTGQDKTNTWLAFRKKFNMDVFPGKGIARIAVDSKYWLWLNGELVVFEGQLKRGPTPSDTYYDEVDLTPFLKQGENTLAILVWYFGKNGFSHHSSGRAGLIFELYTDNKLTLISDRSWKARVHPAYYYDPGGLQPNYRLPESNVCFDAREDIPNWTEADYSDIGWPLADIVAKGGAAPWNKLIKRPIPLWKNWGLLSYKDHPDLPFISSGEPVHCVLPSNIQITPYFEVEAINGQKINIHTDNYLVGIVPTVRAEYITKDSIQKYESLGWMNGHQVSYLFPKGIKVLDLKYRETGFDTDFAGAFFCNDSFFNQLWEKSRRTLYVTMRDTYMDCPDRERAQWWGDAVNELGEAFYALSPSSHTLAKKGILELLNWQRTDGSIYSPVPSGNYDRELPMQMLNSIGFYGLWTYYLHSGDLETIKTVYLGIKKYLLLWKIDNNGRVIPRAGGWTWGDWGANKDMEILFNCWYYLALEGFRNLSKVMQNQQNIEWCDEQKELIKKAFNKTFWNKKEYRSPDYTGKTDDRANALAVLSHLAEPEYYPAIATILQTEFHASPYMEKYVLEALYKMDYPEIALRRMKKRYLPMVDHSYTTLWENWTLPEKGKSGGTNNHAWSGGPLTLLSQYAAGVSPLEAGYATFQVKPQLGDLTEVDLTLSSVSGIIEIKIKKTPNVLKLMVVVPIKTSANIYITKQQNSIKNVFLNNNLIWENGQIFDQSEYKILEDDSNHLIFQIKDGKYEFLAEYSHN
jgi:alpha-L-rhamnosidase